MSSLTRSEYRHEEQRRVTESPFKETKWDRHLDTLLTDLNESVGSGRSPAGTQQRSVVPSSAPGTVTERHGVPGSGDFHERREYVSPDQRTHVVQERYEQTARDGGKPSTAYFYETKPGQQFQSSQTTSEHREKRSETMPYSTRFDTKPGTKYHTTETVTEYQQRKPFTVQYYQKSPSTEAQSQSHYQTIKTISEPKAKHPDFIEYYEEFLPPDAKSSAQYHTTRTVTDHEQKAPTTYKYYEKSPSVERRTTKTVTEYRYPFATPQHEVEQVSQHLSTSTSPEHVDKPPATVRHPSGQPMTVRYVDRKPITIYHEAKSGYTSGGDTPPPPQPPPPATADAKPPTVYYERIIERQPIIHYYGPRPQEAEPRHATLPAGQRSYTTVTQHTQSSIPGARDPTAAATLPPDSKPPAHQRAPPARSPDVPATNQAVTKQVFKSSSYSSDAAGVQAPSQPPPDSSRFKQNILELDSLLDDLDHARKKPGTNGVDPTVQTFDGPAGTSTPYRHTNISKTTKTSKYTTSGPTSGPTEPPPPSLAPGDQLTALGLTGPRHSPSPNPLEGLDRNLVPELSEPPQPGTTRVTKYEYRSSNRRDVSPQPAPAPAPAPARTLPPPDSSRTYVDRREYSSTTNTLDRAPPPDTTDKTVTYVYNSEQAVPPPPVVPSQPGSNTTINYHIYNYGTLGPDGQPVLPPGVLPAGSAPPSAPGTLPRQEVVTNTSTTSSLHRYRDQSPPPPKSPAPGPDTTVSNSYVFEKHSRGPTPQRQPAPAPAGPPGPNTSYTTSTVTKHYTIGPDGREVPARPGSPPYDQQYPKFPVDEPPHGHHTRTTTTTIERTQTHGSPFPARSPSPSGRRPQRDDGPRVPFPGTPRRAVDDIDTPRRVDELMAQIPDTPQDGTYPHGPRRRDLNGKSSTTTHFTVHETEPLMDTQTKVTLDAKSGAVVPQAATKPIAGPPIYYPPGSTEFKPKPESEMMFQSYESRGGGKYKSGYKASGKYKAKGGSKESHAEGGAVIPICLPLCCGAACSVM